jgi:tetratricopeptide (TPR) repeat protein
MKRDTISSSLLTGHHPTLLTGILVVAVTAVVYGHVLDYDFVAWDDNLHVYDNPRFHPVTWSHVLTFWQAPYAHLYMPLTYTVWAALVWLSRMLRPDQLTAELLHRCNVLLHLGSVLVVYRLGLFLQTQGEEKRASGMCAAAAGALLFGLHPLQVEAVVWVSGLKDVLAGWWALVALWQYTEYTQATTRKRQRVHYSLATMAFGLALLAKPAAVVVPVLAWGLAVLYLRQPWRHTAWSVSGWLVVAGVWGVWTKTQQTDAMLGFIPPLWARPVIAVDAIGFYLGKLLWPLGLGPDYGRTPQLVLEHQTGYIACLAAIFLVGGLWWLRHRLQWLVLTMLLLVAALLPVLGGISFIFQDYSTVADRYAYLALLGPALGLRWALHQHRQCRMVWLGSLLLLGGLGWRSVEQVQVWRNTEALFTHALRVNPHSVLAHYNLGHTMAQQGKLEAAITHYHQALRLKPNYVFAHHQLGVALAAQGKLDEAITHYDAALRWQPAYTDAYNSLGLALIQQGKLDEAVRQFTRALEMLPRDARLHNNLGIALAAQGKYPAAIQRFTRAIELQPEYANAYHNLGLALPQQGQHSAAIAALRIALRLRPHWPQAMAALAQLLATQPSAQMLAEALALAEHACEATAYGDASLLHTLAVVAQAAGNPEKAQAMARQAHSLASAAGDTALATQIVTGFPPPVHREPLHAQP